MQLALLVMGLTCVLIATGCMNICTQNEDSPTPFTKYKLLDGRGNVVSPKPDAVFPEVISTNMRPRFLAASFIGYFGRGSKEPSRMTVINYEDLALHRFGGQVLGDCVSYVFTPSARQ